jgi:hypothetical protein
MDAYSIFDRVYKRGNEGVMRVGLPLGIRDFSFVSEKQLFSVRA